MPDWMIQLLFLVLIGQLVVVVVALTLVGWIVHTVLRPKPRNLSPVDKDSKPGVRFGGVLHREPPGVRRTADQG